VTAPVALVVDTDPGIDDALALLLAARWRRSNLHAVTVTYGNTTLDRGTRNARIILDRAPCTAPVIAGADRPLVRDLVTAKETHGAEGLGDHPAVAAAPVASSGTAILDALRAAPVPVTLVTLGPLTNLALALRLDTALIRSRVTRHVAMGGSLKARGTATVEAEFNVWCDPEAADEVVRAGLSSEFVGLDVTRQLVIPAAAVHKLATHADSGARWLGALLGFYVRFHDEYEGLQGAVINDPLAIALAVEPSWGRLERFPIEVDLTSGPSRGRTAVATGRTGDQADFFTSFDLAAVHGLLLDHLFGRWLSRADFNP
jgi:purine nucleosidase